MQRYIEEQKFAVSRYRVYPTPEQEIQLARHCSDARFVWNLAVEQQSWWRPDKRNPPSNTERFRQLTEARACNPWLAEGSVTVQQQALRDFDQAMRNFFNGTHRRPTWRKKGRHEGFRIVAVKPHHIRQVNRRWSEVFVPKVGWLRFRRTRPVPDAVSYRVTRDRAGRWHIAFAAIPPPLPAPGSGEVVGIDRGIAQTLTVSDGRVFQAPDGDRLDHRIRLESKRLSRAERGSKRRLKVKQRLAKLQARQADARKDFVEKTSTNIARRYDLIRIEDLRVADMTRSAKGTIANPGRGVRQKAGLNRSILQQGWSMFATRLGQKARGRVEKVNPAFSSQRCSDCGHIAVESRKSQALFVCVACNYSCNADLNAARNIAAGHAVTARGGLERVKPSNREPLLVAV